MICSGETQFYFKYTITKFVLRYIEEQRSVFAVSGEPSD